MEGMMASSIYTAKDAAEKIGCSIATVSRWAAKLGMTAKHGPSLSLTTADIAAIQKQRYAKSGNPNFVKREDQK
jgi:uncharacterized protein YjcR